MDAPAAAEGGVLEQLERGRALIAEGRALIEAKEYTRATEVLNEAVALAPTSHLAFLERSRALSAHYRRDSTAFDAREQAVKDAKRAAFMQPSSWQCMLQLSKAVGAAGNLEQGLKDLEKAEALAAEDAEGQPPADVEYALLDQRGRLQLELGKEAKARKEPERAWQRLLEEAVRSITGALRLQPRNADTINNRGVAYYESRRFDLAMVDFERAIAVDPSHDRALSNRALVQRIRRDLESAHASLLRSIEENPTSAISFNNLACIERDLGRRVDALGHFSKAAEMDPEYTQAANNRNLLLAELKQPVPIAPVSDVALDDVAGATPLPQPQLASPVARAARATAGGGKS